MNFGKIKEHIRKIIADRLASSQVFTQDEYLHAVVNEVVMPDIVGRYDWFWKEVMETTPLPVGTYQILFPESVQDLRALILMTGSLGTTLPLKYMPTKEFFE